MGKVRDIINFIQKELLDNKIRLLTGKRSNKEIKIRLERLNEVINLLKLVEATNHKYFLEKDK